MEKDLNKELRKTVGEAKAMLAMAAMSSSVSDNEDAGELVMNIKMLKMLNRMVDLCCDVFEKQDKLMDKLDKALDKYLEQE